MKNLIIILFTSLLYACKFSNTDKIATTKKIDENTNAVVTFIPIDTSTLAKKLEWIYNTRNESPQKEIDFFEAFPTTFDEFSIIYSGNNFQAAPLYDSAYAHINFFYSISKVSLEDILMKLIAIGKNGEWDADAINYFQDHLFLKIISNIDTSLMIINNLTKEESLSLWHFLFDGPHPADPGVKKDFDNLYKQVSIRDHKQAQLLEETYRKLLRENDH